MNYHKAFKVWAIPVIATLPAVFFFNWFIDPLWCFSHSNRFNNVQPGFNERQQKTNRIYFTGLNQYDTLLLGSSRTAYIDQHDFKGMNVFNYAADNMLPSEYEKWIEIATSIKGGDFKTIIIGIDFFGTAKNYDKEIRKYYNELTPYHYFRQAEEPFYRYKNLLSLDTFKYALESIKRIYDPTISDYDRKNVRHCSIVVSDNMKQKRIQSNIMEYKKHLTDKYIYRKEWKAILKRLKSRYPQTRFILFTTPVSEPFFKTLILEANHIRDYERWLRESIEVFGEIYHFMDMNTITADLDNFFDAHHVYAKIDRLLAWRISGQNEKNIPDDFGILLNRTNIDSYLNKFWNMHRTNLPSITSILHNPEP